MHHLRLSAVAAITVVSLLGWACSNESSPSNDPSSHAGAGAGHAGGATSGGGQRSDHLDDPSCVPEFSAAALIAASDAIEQGATDVALDDSGCLWIERSFDGENLTREELMRGGEAAMVWEYSETLVTAAYDRGDDGKFQTHFTATRSGSDTVVLIERGEPVSWRQTITDTGSSLALLEEDLEGGESVGYEVPYTQAGVSVDRGSGAGSCTEAAAQHVLDTWNDAYKQGLHCLRDLGMMEAAIYLSYTAASGLKFVCKDLEDGHDAEFSSKSWWFDRFVPYRASTIFIDGDSAGTISGGLLFHELMHAYFPAHHPSDIGSDPQRHHKDPIYACQEICFNPDNADKCSCAKCLETTVDDPRCAAFADCGLWVCPCESNDEIYASEWDCAVDCYNNLACYDAPPCEPLSGLP